MIATTAVLSRLERFERVGSTNDVVRDWLAAGTREVCVAVADEQTAGRGRSGRSWVAPPGAALLLSLGFRPAWLAPEHAWRLAACVSIAMADAAEATAGLASDAIWLKWPNDLVGIAGDRNGDLRKLGGVLGEGTGLGTADPTVVVGIGVNAGWDPRQFPGELRTVMTSLLELSGGRPIDPEALLQGFLERVEGRVERLREGAFDADEWADRQVTTGRQVTLETDAGAEVVEAVGVDPDSGALLVGAPGAERSVLVGDVRHVRLGAV